MTRLEITAIRALPLRYVRDGTQVTSVRVQKGILVVALNPSLPVIRYASKDRRWVRFTFSDAPICPILESRTIPSG